jgi:hypothetical protein
MRKGQGLLVPYARKWAAGGCEPIQSLKSFPYDGLLILGEGLYELHHAVAAYADRLVIECAPETVWVAANRSVRGDGPPDAYLVGTGEDQNARYVGDTAEVVIQIVRGMSKAAPNMEAADELQVGFPGLRNTQKTYVGSWQWGVHGEASDDEFVRRAATATLKAIDAKKERDAGHPG